MIEEIKKAIKVMTQGGVILYPTDTIWGLGCDATNEQAVATVYEIKKRIDSKALICLVDNAVKIDYYVDTPPEIAFELMEASEKPVTIIYDNGRNLAPNLLAEDGSIAIRVTEEEISQQLCRQFRKAIVSTSANISGEPSPQCYDEISEEILQAVDYILPLRQDERQKNKSSSIIKLGVGGVVKVIRP